MKSSIPITNKSNQSQRKGHPYTYLKFRSIIIAFLLIGICVSEACVSPYEGYDPELLNQLSVHCFLEESKSITTIRLAKLKSPIDTFYDPIREEFEVKLITADTFYIAKLLQQTGEPIVTYFIDQVMKSSNSKYVLEVLRGEELLLKSTMIAPLGVAPDLRFEGLVSKSLQSGSIQMATAEINLLPVGTGEQYYHIIAKKIKWINDGGSPRFIGSEEILHTAILGLQADEVETLEHEPGVLFTTDRALPKLTLQVRTKDIIDNREEFFRQVSVELRKVNKEYYQYHKSINTQIQNKRLGLPALEPVIVFSNIEGGNGVFCAFQANSVSFTLD